MHQIWNVYVCYVPFCLQELRPDLLRGLLGQDGADAQLQEAAARVRALPRRAPATGRDSLSSEMIHPGGVQEGKSY